MITDLRDCSTLMEVLQYYMKIGSHSSTLNNLDISEQAKLNQIKRTSQYRLHTRWNFSLTHSIPCSCSIPNKKIYWWHANRPLRCACYFKRYALNRPGAKFGSMSLIQSNVAGVEGLVIPLNLVDLRRSSCVIADNSRTRNYVENLLISVTVLNYILQYLQKIDFATAIILVLTFFSLALPLLFSCSRYLVWSYVCSITKNIFARHNQ